jgi:hypothetical protein
VQRTHALALQGALPAAGSAAGASAPAAPKKLPFASTSAPPAAAPKTLAEKEMPAGATTTGKALTFSAALPDRKKAASFGAVGGAQPAEAERKAAPAAQRAQELLP